MLYFIHIPNVSKYQVLADSTNVIFPMKNFYKLLYYNL